MRRAAILLLASLCGLAVTVEAATVNATLRFDSELQAGADAEGRLLVFTPKPLARGSSVAHFDPSASPNLLMEPGISADLRAGRVDLTLPAMQDFGWRRGSFRGRINYTDGAGTGFNHPTLGAARRAAFEFAVGRWQRLLASSITVNVDASFGRLQCDENGATLAGASPAFAFIDFPGGDPGVWYSGALAESLSGQNLSLEDTSDPAAAEFFIVFNSEIDNECLAEGTSYYYGTNDNAGPGQISFVSVAMHEMGHGLGFTSLANESTGALFRGSPDAYSRLLFDNKVGKHWDEMSASQRRKSAVRPGKVVLDGDRTTAAAADFLSGSDVLLINSPRSLAGVYQVGGASFGPPLSEAGVTADLALVRDGSANPTFACRPLTNPDEIAGKIALIDRGECFFVEKVKNAQDAGAIGVIIIHNEPGPPPGLGGSDPSIDIPSVRVGKRDGRRLKRRVKKL